MARRGSEVSPVAVVGEWIDRFAQLPGHCRDVWGSERYRNCGEASSNVFADSKAVRYYRVSLDVGDMFRITIVYFEPREVNSAAMVFSFPSETLSRGLLDRLFRKCEGSQR
jgi:hypothetical protein